LEAIYDLTLIFLHYLIYKVDDEFRTFTILSIMHDENWSNLLGRGNLVLD